MFKKLNKNAEALSQHFSLGRREAAATELLLTEVRLASGELLTRQGGVGSRQIIVILEGEAEVRRDGATIAVLGKGDLVGEITMLGYARCATADVECIGEVRALAGGISDVARLNPRGAFLGAMHRVAEKRRAPEQRTERTRDAERSSAVAR